MPQMVKQQVVPQMVKTPDTPFLQNLKECLSPQKKYMCQIIPQIKISEEETKKVEEP